VKIKAKIKVIYGNILLNWIPFQFQSVDGTVCTIQLPTLKLVPREKNEGHSRRRVRTRKQKNRLLVIKSNVY
jgi:hypothetical protein